MTGRINRNVVPWEDQTVNVTSGIRVGSPAVTTRGFTEEEMRRTGEFILRTVEGRADAAALEGVRGEVLDLLEGFPLYEFL